MFGNKGLDGFTYKGFKYTYDLQQEDDNCKTLHECVMPNGKTVHMPWSPYSNPTESDFKLWIDLGCPENISGGNNTRETLEYIKGVGFITWIFDLKSKTSDWNRQGVRVTCGMSEALALECIAKTWPHSEVLNLREDNYVQQQCELFDIEASIPRNYTRKEQEQIDQQKVDGE